jgi:hypothetical protein
MSAKTKTKEDVRLEMIADAGHFDIADPRSRSWVDVEKIVVEAAKA